MKTELANRRFLLFVFQLLLAAGLILGGLALFNSSVDASRVISSKAHDAMAKLALEGNTVAAPENYNERVYQLAIVNNQSAIPETVMIGSSRGMFLGREITGFENLYNHCVSGGCLEDDYALLGLYEQKYARLPSRVILEISPWLFYGGNPEARWLENYSYRTAAEKLYSAVNGQKLEIRVKKENPYLSVPYLQYNFSVLCEQGFAAFRGDEARVSADPTEAADLPDGTIRYAAALEERSAERLAAVTSVSGPVTYQNADKMTELDEGKTGAFERLVRYLLDRGTEVIFYLQPFSPTQCRYSFDEALNPAFGPAEAYLRSFAARCGVETVGAYDSRLYPLTDEDFIDFMHLDKTGTRTVWQSDYGHAAGIDH